MDTYMHDDDCEWVLRGCLVLVCFIGYFFLNGFILN